MDMKKLNRRQAVSLLGGAAAVGAGSSLAGPAFGQAEPPKPAQIVVNHSGGAMGTAMRKAFFNGYEKKYGIRVVETSPVDMGKLRATVESGNVEWDVTEIGGQDAIRATKLGLLEKIDPKIVDLEVSADSAEPLCFRLVGLYDHHRLPHRRLQERQPAQELGGLVGRQEVPGRALDAQPSDRQSRVRADR
jgi:hypothetical protein